MKAAPVARARAGGEASAGGQGGAGGDMHSSLCSGQCAPPAPLGWFGPALLWFGPAEAVPDCPADAPTLGYEGFADLQQPPMDCAICACDPPEASCALPTGWAASSSVLVPRRRAGHRDDLLRRARRLGRRVHRGEPDPRRSALRRRALRAVAHDRGALDHDRRVHAAHRRPAACPQARSVGDAGQGVPRRRVHRVRGRDDVRASGAVGLPDLRLPRGRRRRLSGGVRRQARLLRGRDRRPRVHPCGCGDPTGASCTLMASVFRDAACTDLLASNLVSSSVPFCVVTPPGVGLGSKSAVIADVEPGACAPHGGEPVGELQASAPSTFCCTA